MHIDRDVYEFTFRHLTGTFIQSDLQLRLKGETRKRTQSILEQLSNILVARLL